MAFRVLVHMKGHRNNCTKNGKAELKGRRAVLGSFPTSTDPANHNRKWVWMLDRWFWKELRNCKAAIPLIQHWTGSMEKKLVALHAFINTESTLNRILATEKRRGEHIKELMWRESVWWVGGISDSSESNSQMSKPYFLLLNISVSW